MPARKSTVGPSSRSASATWDRDTTRARTRTSTPGNANAASGNPIGRIIAPSKATAKIATDNVSVAISLKSSHRAVAPAHGYVWNAVLDEWFPGHLESK